MKSSIVLLLLFFKEYLEGMIASLNFVRKHFYATVKRTSAQAKRAALELGPILNSTRVLKFP